MPGKKIIAVIPARYASVRFPGKPLAMIGQMSMIERVYRQALKAAAINHVTVATDDERIKNHVESFGGNVILTSPSHQSGTDRCAEAINLSDKSYDVVINVQGDEPFINPGQIDLLASCFDEPQTQIATLVKKTSSEEEINNPNIPKVVIKANGDALYFSRALIPFNRNSEPGNPTEYFRHIGIYGYRTDILREISRLKPGKLEMIESLEQLRWLENGYCIKTAVSNHDTIAVDTPEDLEKVKVTFNL